MSRFLKSVFGFKRDRSERKRAIARHTALSLEGLEARDVPSVTLANGILSIVGTNGVNYATVEYDTMGTVFNYYDDQIVVKLGSGGPVQSVHPFDFYRASFTYPTYYLKTVDEIRFDGLGGSDYFDNQLNIPSKADGGEGHDTLWGGNGNDTIQGKGGNDYLDGFGNDTLYGQDGNDTLYGYQGNDYLSGGAGNDQVYGGSGHDTVNGDSNDDRLEGGDGNDILYGGTGHDTLSGQGHDDQLYGGSGNDDLYAGTGSNYMIDEPGDDYVDWSQNAVGVNFDTSSGNDTVIGTDFNDTIDGSDGNDSLVGGAGHDILKGGRGHDTVSGQAGNDEIDGQAGNDSLLGGNDNDTLDGGFGLDTLLGGSGNDTLVDGPGWELDVLNGETGVDTLLAGAGDTLSSGEIVNLYVDNFQHQNDSWSCGPNSASRLLRSYGIDVSYSTLRQEAASSNIISDYGLGTPPPELRDLMAKYKPNTQRESGVSLQRVLDLLGQGKPIVALIGEGATTIPIFHPYFPIPLEFVTVPDRLHYIVLTGYNLQTQQIFFTDTNGAQTSYTFNEFVDRSYWTATGSVGLALSALGITQGTILY